MDCPDHGNHVPQRLSITNYARLAAFLLFWSFAVNHPSNPCAFVFNKAGEKTIHGAMSTKVGNVNEVKDYWVLLTLCYSYSVGVNYSEAV